MSNFDKTLLSITGVLLAALMFVSTLAWSFITAIPNAVQDNHDASIVSKIERASNRRSIAEVAERQRADSIDKKAQEKALTMLSGDVKHLTETVESQNRKLDELGRYWREYTASPIAQ